MLAGKSAGWSAFVLAVLSATASGWEWEAGGRVVYTVPAGAAESNQQARTAAFLAETLGRLTGRPVTANPSETGPETGIHLRLVPPAAAVTAEAVFSGRLESYVIEAAGRELRITGPTAAGVHNGVMAFLHRQGCRWLLPSPNWWIVSEGAKVAFSGREEGTPSFAYRRIWYAYGTGDAELARRYQVWSDANRLGGVAAFATGHSYNNIMERNKADFEAHPDYFARADGQTNRLKFCLSNPGLRALCLRDRIALLQAQRMASPHAFMVSMDPSDGQGTCDCADCRKLGSTTDRVVSLANHVARGLREAVPGGWVGMYAYSSHREPPALAMESNIHVQVAMAFNKTGLTYEDLIRLWGAKAGSLGIREYYGVEAWDFGMPGRIRGANPAYHGRWLPLYRKAGAVSVSAESNDNWGPQALGFYVAARLLWDVDADPGAVAGDFLASAFGSAAKPMGALYADFAAVTKATPGNLTRMYDRAFEALEKTADPGVRGRITDVIAYLNYVDLFARFERCEPHTEPYYAALDAVMNYAHRIQPRGMVAAYALARRLCNANVKGKRDDFWLFGDKVIWKRGAPLTDEDVLAIAAGARTALAKAAAARVEFSRDLVLRTGLPGPGPAPVRTLPFRHRVEAYLTPLAAGAFTFQMGTGASAYVETFPQGERLAEFTSGGATGGAPAAVNLSTGVLYRLVLRAGGATVTATFPEGLAVALEASPDQPLWLESGTALSVFVPAGTPGLRCSGNPRLSVLDPDGRRTDVGSAGQGGEEYTLLPAGPGQAGRLWTIGTQTRGEIAFFNVPPLAQMDSGRVLLPREVRTAGEPGSVKEKGTQP